jgi:amino acid transporter
MLLALIIALAARTSLKLKNSANFVFSDFSATGYWISNGWAFVLSFLRPVRVVSRFESSATIAEEASNAAQAVPFAIVSSLVTATTTRWAALITIASCMGTDMIGLVTSPLGQPWLKLRSIALAKVEV